ncbi:hypothetical protein MVEN_01165000 [Mycena venus]|uniref:Uncharacterized protein n=1 Tax=Mycena venus TaxID=2733690 RepID=A0A8H6Y572_9AGAR|nr:hypothetical protein MVEN_01165000 [Mycena venus]
MRPFAQELVEQVIDCSADSNAMKAWGLVCKTWLPRTRYHLFSKVSLSHDNLSSFVDLVEASPLPLLSCIHDLTLCYNGAPPDTELLGRIHSCPNLRSISIQIRGSFEENQDAPDWLDSEESFLVHIRAWGTISSSISTLNLEVQGIDDIPLQTIVDIIACVPTITRLSMHGDDETWEFINADGGIPPSFPLALKELDLTGNGTDSLFEWLLTLPIIPCLKHLNLHGSLGDVSRVIGYIQQAGHELEDFRVHLPIPETDTLPFLEQVLPYTPKLKTISFDCWEPSTALAILRLLPSSGLHFIKFSFLPDSTEGVPWAEFDLTLAVPRFSALRGVSVYSYEERHSLITTEIKLLMPLASARGILE